MRALHIRAMLHMRARFYLLIYSFVYLPIYFISFLVYFFGMTYGIRNLLHSAIDRFENKLERNNYTLGLICKTIGFRFFKMKRLNSLEGNTLLSRIENFL